MANEPIDVLPCKPPLPFPSNEPPGIYDDPSAYFNSLNGSNSQLITPFFQFDENASLIDGFNSSDPFGRAITLQPPDLLITNPFFLTLTISSMLGNLAMLGVILFTPQFRKPANYLIVNLSLSSIFFIASTNLRMIENGYYILEYTTLRCRLLAVLHRRVARNPMNGSSSISPAWKSVFIWSFSLLIVIPLGFTREFEECTPNNYKCSKIFLFGQSSYSIFYGVSYLLSVHVFPAAILIRESVKTQKLMKFLRLTSMAHMHQQLERAISPYPSSASNFPDNRLRLLRNSCWFTTIFLGSWLPYGIFQFPLDLPKELLPELLLIYISFYFKFFRYITYLQIALNPVVLFALSYDLRMYLARVKCAWGYGKHHSRHPIHNPRCNRLGHAIQNRHSLP